MEIWNLALIPPTPLFICKMTITLKVHSDPLLNFYSLTILIFIKSIDNMVELPFWARKVNQWYKRDSKWLKFVKPSVNSIQKKRKKKVLIGL